MYIQLYVKNAIDWNAEKSLENLLERGFDFEFAVGVFEGVTLEKEDRRIDYGEKRIIAIGRVDGIELTVVFTDRPDSIGHPVRRIISARRSNRHERQAYQKTIEANR